MRELASTPLYAVHEVIRHRDGRHLAIKVLVERDGIVSRGRFKNEVRLLARLDHPNIIRIVDQNLDEYQPWVLTPLYLYDLRKYIRALPVRDPVDNVAIFSAVLDAVEYSHSQGVIHRDIKPANILLNSPTDVVLIDFSISVSTNGDQTRHTQSGHPLGTPYYLAPEQLHAPGTADARADIFSLGVLLFEMLGGLVGSSALDMEPVPQRYRAFIVRAISPKPANRYSTVSEMKRIWRLLRDSEAQQSELTEITEMAARGALQASEVSRLEALLAAYSSDRDLLDRFFVSADPETLSSLAQDGSTTFFVSLLAWLKFVEAQSWPFAYTDKIAERCKFLASVIADDSIRAELVKTVLIIGNSHHRYKVWRIAADLIQACAKDPNTAELLAAVLATHCSADDFDGVQDYLRTSALPSSIRALVFANQPESSFSPN